MDDDYPVIGRDVSYDHESKTWTIYGCKYSDAMLRTFGQLAEGNLIGSIFRVDKGPEGRLNLTRLSEGGHEN